MVITPPNSLCSIRNPIIWTAQASANWGSLSGYRVSLQVLAEDTYRGNTWSAVDTMYLTPDASGEMVADLRWMLGGLVKPDPPTWPANAAAELCTKMNRRIRIVSQELWSGGNTNAITSDPIHIVRAGFDEYKGQNLAAWVAAQRMLTWQPTRTMGKKQPDWLYFVAPDVGDYTLTGTLYFEDGTLQTGFFPPYSTGFGTTISLSAQGNDIIRFPAGWPQLNLGAIANPVKEWELWVQTSSGVRVSEKKRYRIDCLMPEYLARYYIWEGSLGGWHSLMALGEAELNGDPTSTSFTRILRHDAPRNAHADDYTDTRYRLGVTQYAGYVDAATADWLRDLSLLSERVYRVGSFTPNRTGTGDWIPIRLVREQFLLRKDSDFLYALSFAYTEARTHQGL